MRGAATFLCLLVLAILGSGPIRADAAQSWHSQQPVGEGGFSPLLGEVGDVECWEANRCLLINAGNAGVQAGVFAYDGSSWYRYSTVCGGHAGRIAWAGPDDFWTISDQQPGHAATPHGENESWAVSLCHFKGGTVVASYAEPVLSSLPYRPMNAAACGGLSDCWFAGQRLPATVLNPGAFHLHWNGNSITQAPSPTVASEISNPVREVTGLAYHQGTFYEGVRIQGDDVPTKDEEDAEATLGPSFLHEIEAGPVFKPLFGAEAFDFESAEASEEALATELDGFRLTGSDEEALWAISGSSEANASLTVLRLEESGELVQVPLEGTDPVPLPPLLAGGVKVAAVAAEPARDEVWIAYRRRGEAANPPSPARLARVRGDGGIAEEVALPAMGETAGGAAVGPKGGAAAMACAEPEQCWMATSAGWLFHLGPNPPIPNSDPAMHVLITSRPTDDSVPVLPPLELPEDDSGAGQKGTSSQIEIEGGPEELPRRLPPLYSNVKQRLLHGAIIELSFTLHKKARVQLVAKRNRQVVAKTKRYTMVKGRHSLRLELNPKHWPTKLDLQIKALSAKESK